MTAEFAPQTTLDILFARALAVLDDLAEYQPTSLAEVHTILERTAGRETATGSLTEKIADIIERAGRSQHLTDLLDQGDLVQAATAYASGSVLDGDVADVIGEALDAIRNPWDARTADEFHRAHNVLVLDSQPALPAADTEKAVITAPQLGWDDGPVIPKIPNPRPPSDPTVA